MTDECGRVSIANWRMRLTLHIKVEWSSVRKTLVKQRRRVHFGIVPTPRIYIHAYGGVRGIGTSLLSSMGVGASLGTRVSPSSLPIVAYSSLHPTRSSKENERAETNETDPTAPCDGKTYSRARADPSESAKVRGVGVVPMHWSNHAQQKGHLTW
ncbi:hypothetical protein FA13DRAFT_1743487 [Coprinellus micaceus]|uniref:Uncharacterized protein n=1 Tax=Coprinellus micaceus TaxID=71717 RepID=A0A4Y7SEU1_COPMI|nr:hypothetical protein FA13DRAFT_1743487 [Coprinellus micaceus]